jgi:hypothetical protein
MINAPNFPEWMVNEALSRYLKRDKQTASRMEWFFTLPAQSPQGDVKVRDLSGFDWRRGEVFWQAEKSLTP